MNSRPMTYTLVAAALVVWGVIAWKIVFSDEDPPAITAAVPRADETPKPERYPLSLDYADPFLKDDTAPDRTETTGLAEEKRAGSIV